MSDAFRSPRSAARALIDHPAPNLSRRSGSFLGQIVFDREDEPLSERQVRWLQDLLKKHGLPPLLTGGEA